MANDTYKAAKDGEDDLAIFYPERTATIAGVPVVMREYGWVEGMKLNAHIAPIVDAMAALAISGEITDPEALRPVFADHADSVAQLVAAACDQPVAWVSGLNDDNGSALQLLWWTVNAHFFGRRVVRSVLTQELRASAGQTSTLHSPAPATHPSTSNAGRVVS